MADALMAYATELRLGNGVSDERQREMMRLIAAAARILAPADSVEKYVAEVMGEFWLAADGSLELYDGDDECRYRLMAMEVASYALNALSQDDPEPPFGPSPSYDV